ncbi:MAG: prepilin-type N-terminal cleavage/methylation domain-containing protein [Victivallales bacterium]|nr:prepilin-type N-terminal cleavage/methylation domain-containing protein [Victivallales bacterium]
MKYKLQRTKVKNATGVSRNYNRLQSDGYGIRSAINFTMVELLIVMAIIAILASMLLPTIQQARMKGFLASCTSNMRQLSLAVAMYSNDHDGWLPNCNGGNSNWVERIALAGGSAAGWNYGWKSGASPATKKLFLCPVGNNEAYYGVNYSYNKRVGYYHSSYGYPAVAYCAPRRIDQVRSPGNRLLIIDGKDKTYSITAIDSNISQVDFRHSSGTNILWFDGHVSMCKYYEVKSFNKEWKP